MAQSSAVVISLTCIFLYVFFTGAIVEQKKDYRVIAGVFLSVPSVDVFSISGSDHKRYGS